MKRIQAGDWEYILQICPPSMILSTLLPQFLSSGCLLVYLFMCVNVLPKCMCVCIPCLCLVPQRPEEGIRYPETVVTDDCEPSCGSWNWTCKSNKCSKPFVPSLQPPCYLSFPKIFFWGLWCPPLSLPPSPLPLGWSWTQRSTYLCAPPLPCFFEDS